jgi:hypothetical protein
MSDTKLSDEMRLEVCVAKSYGEGLNFQMLNDWTERVSALEVDNVRLRAALEWLADMSEGCAQVSPCPANKPLSDANKEALCRECLVQAALKAAEEATPDDHDPR